LKKTTKTIIRAETVKIIAEVKALKVSETKPPIKTTTNAITKVNKVLREKREAFSFSGRSFCLLKNISKINVKIKDAIPANSKFDKVNNSVIIPP
jgi:hypothetical protein